MTTQHLASPLAASWLSQLRHLNSQLNQEPNNPLAWHWRIRIKVLSFLVSRYGDDESLDFRPEAEKAILYIPNIEVPTRPMRSRAEIRKTLTRIVDANHYRVARKVFPWLFRS